MKLKNIFASAVCLWNLDASIGSDFQFNSDYVFELPCSIEQDYRSWEKSISPSIDEYTGEMKMLLTYKDTDKKYFEIWNIKTRKLEILIADKNYWGGGIDLK